MTSIQPGSLAPTGSVLFAYDGSELAAVAIEQAGSQLATGRDAVVLCIWQPADVGFVPVTKRHFDADDTLKVHQAAEETAAHGASLADKAGFRSQSLAVEGAPTWKGIIETAEERKASLIVIGSHRRSGLVGHFLGNVAAGVVAHTALPVLIVHPQT